MGPPPSILDTHIHLWPSTAVSPTDHAWMTPNHALARQHGIRDYAAATAPSPVQPSAFVYVETDRYLPSSAPPSASPASIEAWAKAPLAELAFLQRMVAGTPQEGDGFDAGDGSRLKGLVIWAPFHLGPDVFEGYVQLAKVVLKGKGGVEDAWERVVGFRYLLQGRGAEDVRRIVQSEDFVQNVATIAGKAFDVGVDCHRDGVEALEAVVGMVERVRAGETAGAAPKVKFVLNHLCKPDLSRPFWPAFPRWQAALSRLAADPNVYMKISGAFNEFSPEATPSSAAHIIEALRPYLDHILAVFGPKRIMFGSDWPVCNVGGPKAADQGGNWSFWRELLEDWMEKEALGEEEREWVWWKTGREAYGIQGI